MSDSAKIRSIDALDVLAAGLGQYAAHAQQVMAAAIMEAKRTIAWLEQRQQFWRNEVLRRKEIVRRASAIYHDCKRPVYDARTKTSYVASCDAELQQFRNAERYLDEAKDEEQKVLRAKYAVQSALEHYQKEARHLQSTLQNQVPTSVGWLRRKAAVLRSYAASQPGLSVGEVFAGAAILGIGAAMAAQQGAANLDDAESVKTSDGQSTKPYDDVSVKTKTGADQCLRVYHGQKSDLLRVFNANHPPSATPTLTASYANITHEKSLSHDELRTRLNDIVVHESERGNGIGAALLAECEHQAKLHGSTEIYGTFIPGVSETEQQSPDFRQKVKNWYEKQGYAFRASGGLPDGEVFKVIICL